MRITILGFFLFLIFPASLISDKKAIDSENVFISRGDVCLMVFGSQACGLVGSQYFDNLPGSSWCGTPLQQPFVWLDRIISSGCLFYSISDDASFRVDAGSYGASVHWAGTLTVGGIYPVDFTDFKLVGCRGIPVGCP